MVSAISAAGPKHPVKTEKPKKKEKEADKKPSDNPLGKSYSKTHLNMVGMHDGPLDKKGLMAEGFSDKEADKLLKKYDSDKDGEIDRVAAKGKKRSEFNRMFDDLKKK